MERGSITLFQKKSVCQHLSLRCAEMGKGAAQPVCLTVWSGGLSVEAQGRSAFTHTKLQLVSLLSGRWPLLAEKGVFFCFVFSLRAAPVSKFLLPVFDVCVRDVSLMCEVVCGSQQNEDVLCCREDCSRGARKEGENPGGREGHWCISSSDGRQKSSSFMATHTGTCLSSVLPLTVFFSSALLSFFCPLQIMWERVPGLWPPCSLRRRRKLLCQYAHIFPLLNEPSRNYTLHPTFLLNYSLMHWKI